MRELKDGRPLELRRRRPHAWTGGAPVALADGSRWYLPRVDFRLVFATWGLRADFLEAFRLAREARGAEGFSPELVRYQLHMITLGHRLLTINYDAPDEEWAELLRFESLVGAVLFTRAVGAAVSDSRAAWDPPAGPADGRGFSPN